jgi:RNA recognition motif-containing protein
MKKKLFIGGLAWSTTDDSLKAAFDEFGEVTEARVITDRETGRSRGFGFVSFTDPAHAQAAKDAMDNQPIDGRNVRVDFAHDKGRS